MRDMKMMIAGKGKPNIGSMKDKVDLDVIDEIIKMAEGSMATPFKKKKGMVIAEVEPKEEGLEDDGMDEMSGEDRDQDAEYMDDESSGKHEISDEDWAELQEYRRKMRG